MGKRVKALLEEHPDKRFFFAFGAGWRSLINRKCMKSQCFSTSVKILSLILRIVNKCFCNSSSVFSVSGYDGQKKKIKFRSLLVNSPKQSKLVLSI